MKLPVFQLSFTPKIFPDKNFKIKRVVCTWHNLFKKYSTKTTAFLISLLITSRYHLFSPKADIYMIFTVHISFLVSNATVTAVNAIRQQIFVQQFLFSNKWTVWFMKRRIATTTKNYSKLIFISLFHTLLPKMCIFCSLHFILALMNIVNVSWQNVHLIESVSRFQKHLIVWSGKLQWWRVQFFVFISFQLFVVPMCSSHL